MVVFRLTLDDLARTRFAVSPTSELAASLRALQNPSTAAAHVPWIRGLKGRLGELDLRAALALVPARGFAPDFLAPPPRGPVGDLAEELELIRAADPELVRRDVRIRLREGAPRAVLAPFLERPRRAVAALADALAAYWALAVEPHWPRIRRLLDADLAHRARRLTEGGPAALFADLHPAVRWRAPDVHVDILTFDVDVPLTGQGLLCMPSVFAWTHPSVVTDAPWQPTLAYPARGVALLWDTGAERTPEALAGVLGRSRARILTALDAPRSTSELAEVLDISPGGASQHLGALRAAGLVAARREGRVVLYGRTEAADALVAAAG
jgi:DNA-binding transcriptional ArsR family regulator